MGIIKSIILLPFLPLRLAWKWSSETKLNGQGGGCAHAIGFLIVAVLLYGLIGWGIMSLIEKFR